MKNICEKFVILVSITALTTGCGLFIEKAPKGWPRIEPRPLTGIRGFPGLDTDYGLGFRAGCGAAWDAVTKGLTSDISPKKMDPVKLVSSPDYSTGWSDGFEQCTYIVDWNVV